MCCAKSLASIFHVPPQDKLIIVQAELDCSFNRNLYCDANMYFYVKVSFFLSGIGSLWRRWCWHYHILVSRTVLPLTLTCHSFGMMIRWGLLNIRDNLVFPLLWVYCVFFIAWAVIFHLISKHVHIIFLVTWTLLVWCSC